MKTENHIPVFCVTGASGTGKTTLLVQLLPELAKRGIRTAVYKHDAHDTDWDQKGKDSQKLTGAGATVTGLLSVSRTMRIENRSTSLQEMIRATKDVDLILLEGFHDCPYPKIQIYRAAVGKALRVPPEQCAAMVTDTPFAGCAKQFGLEEVAELAEWIVEHCDDERYQDLAGGKIDGGSEKSAEHRSTAESRKQGTLSLKRQTRISVEEAQARILQLMEQSGIRRNNATERLPLLQCRSRVLAEDVRAMCTQPPFDSSAMDGYALRSAETVQASADHAVSFSVVGTITAGMGMNGLEELPACHAGEAVRIMTGAPLPIGADCVIRQEDTAEESMGDELRVEISRVVKMGDCVCRKGENFRTGEVLLKAGTSLDAAAIGLAASSGNRQLCVRRPQRAVLLITGSEIVRAGEEFAEGQVLDAMESYLSIRLEELGITPVACRVVPDDPAQLVRAVLELSEQADAILSTGGVSVGIHDYMQRVVEEVGGTVVFHGIAMKPGMPTMLSVVRGVPMLSLSGNPSAAAVAFELLMPHVQEAVFHRAAEAVLANNFEKNSPVRRFLWGYSDGGQVWAAEHQRNSNIRSMVGQNCLIDIPAGSGPLTAGSSVTVHWLKNVSTS